MKTRAIDDFLAACVCEHVPECRRCFVLTRGAYLVNVFAEVKSERFFGIIFGSVDPSAVVTADRRATGDRELTARFTMLRTYGY